LLRREFLCGATALTLAGCGSNHETMSWIAKVGEQDGTVSSTRRALVDALISGLKTDGVWSKLDRLWLFAAENATSALVDVKDGQLATAVSSPTFTTDRGYTGNGSSSYIDSNYNPTTNATNFVQNSGCAFGWSNTSGVDGGGLVGQSNVNIAIVPKYTDNNTYWGINTAANESTDSLSGDTGLWVANRSGTSAEQLYLNGSSVHTGTVVSQAIQSVNLYALRVFNIYSARQCCCLGVGGSLNATEQGNLYKRLRTYMTAVGVPGLRPQSSEIPAGGRGSPSP
jgi:hypothetical protein